VEEISNRYGYFPLLFPRGRRGTGKSDTAEIMTGFFGAHREVKPFNFSSTAKAIQRALARYRGIPITINEYAPTPSNNSLLCSIFDREGYSRAKTDNSLDVNCGEINATAIVISTHNITGYKAEDVLSRVVEVDSNDFVYLPEEMNLLLNHLDRLSGGFIKKMLSLSADAVLAKIEEVQKAVRETLINARVNQRILSTHAMIKACASFIGHFDDDMECDIVGHTQNVNSVDVGQTFLDTLHTMLLQGEIKHDLTTNAMAKIEDGKVLFRLREVLPLVERFSSQAHRACADIKTLEASLKSLGCSSKMSRELGNQGRIWAWDAQEKE
jgi:hypothetical protein